MSEGGGELFATDEPTFLAKPLLDPIVVEDSQGDRSFAEPSCADESNRGGVFSEANDLNQFIASKDGPR